MVIPTFPENVLTKLQRKQCVDSDIRLILTTPGKTHLPWASLKLENALSARDDAH